MKRILALDGGGIRGVFSLTVLAKIEAIFRAERGRRTLVLREEFDFFAGTSTGAIIASCLAWGMSVDEILTLYRTRGREMFTKAGWMDRYWTGLYDPRVIARLFKDLFFDDETQKPALLGCRRLWGATPADQKHLLVVMRNATAGSAWPVSNNPFSKYNDRARADCNLDLPLWKLLRASTAAPVYFPPEEIRLGPRTDLFVDGGMTPYNNPALIAVLMATLPAYAIGWPAGRDVLQVVSVGTGTTRAQLTKQAARNVNNTDVAQFIVPALLGSAGNQQDLLCRVLGHCVFGAPIDRELGALAGDGLLAATEKKFTYLRYNRALTAAEIAEFERSSGKKFSLDNTELIEDLAALGAAYAEASVCREHFFPSEPP
ncbi:MAG: patatin-like phospholipase family protein [Opitutae bacterium]|nr:patatin-like phospholipase family protein [Opitutae bacterium]